MSTERQLRRWLVVGGAVTVALGAGAAFGQGPAVDGVLDDWAGMPTSATDPTGDSSGPLDLTALRVQSRGTRVFVQLDFANTFNLAAGPGTDTTLRMFVTRGASNVTVDFRARTAWLNSNPSNDISWTALGYAALPTAATNRFELVFDAAAIGASVGNTINISFNQADSFSAVVPFTLSQAAVAPVRRSAARTACGPLRVVSLNTEFSGLIDAARRAQLVRLIDAANADVYCFQEEYDSTQAEVLSAIMDADPLENGAAWSVLKSGELAIASHYPLVSVTLGTAHQAAVVRASTGGNGVDTLVVNNHLKCCGYTGSSEDNQRISQVNGAVASFAQFRAGTLSGGVAAYKDAPVIVVGDWNLVGSATPLDLWMGAQAPALSRAMVRHQIGDDAWTWSDPDGFGFWPGVLDLVVHEAARVRVVKSFTLDTADLNAGELTALGLQAGDSAATDHAMVVVDFSWKKSADFNASGTVTVQDMFSFLAAWFGLSGAADFNGNGSVTPQDLFDFLAQWFAVC